MIKYIEGMRDSLTYLKKYLESSKEDIKISTIKDLVAACTDSFNSIFNESDLVNSTGLEEKLYMEFIDERKLEGSDAMVLAKTKNQHIMVGTMCPEDLAYFVNILMKNQEVTRYALRMKLKEKTSVYDIPGVKEVEKEFVKQMATGNTSKMFEGKDILAKASDKIAEIDKGGLIGDRQKKVTNIIKELLGDLKEMNKDVKVDPNLSDGLSDSLNEFLNKEGIIIEEDKSFSEEPEPRYDILDRYFDFMGLQIPGHAKLQTFLVKLKPQSKVDWRSCSKNDMAEMYARDCGISVETFECVVNHFGFKKGYEIRKPAWVY